MELNSKGGISEVYIWTCHIKKVWKIYRRRRSRQKRSSVTFDCLYCEVGKGKTVSQIENPPQVKEIISELQDFLKISGYPDVITVTARERTHPLSIS
ncbi:MAG: hypothetical protein Q9M89_07680 [Persephonella sp.]|nr:hypothetical protein [Persephonella sp.]